MLTKLFNLRNDIYEIYGLHYFIAFKNALLKLYIILIKQYIFKNINKWSRKNKILKIIVREKLIKRINNKLIFQMMD